VNDIVSYGFRVFLICFYTMRHCASTAYAMALSVRLSVRPSVTSRCSINTARK